MEVLDLSGGVKVEPLVSIITPSYNSEKYLDAFFISILEQDYEKYEIMMARLIELKILSISIRRNLKKETFVLCI